MPTKKDSNKVKSSQVGLQDNAAKKDSMCKKCVKVVTDDDKGLQCEVCEDWFHCKCVGVSAQLYQRLKENECLHWYCIPCNSEVESILKNKKSVRE